MAGPGRPGRPKGSKNKPRVTSTLAPNAYNPSASSSLDTGRPASLKQPSNEPPVPPRSSLPPSVLASLERPSVTNYALNHRMFSGSEKVSEKKYLKEVKAFASAKNVSEDFVNSCVSEAKRLLEERKPDSAASAKDMGDAAARADDDHGHDKKHKNPKKKDSGEEDAPAPVTRQEELEEPAKAKKKKHKKKDGSAASASTQHITVKREAEEPVAELEKPKKHKKKHKSSESAALVHEEPPTQAEDADSKGAKKHKKGKTPESAGESAKPADTKSEGPSTEGKKSKKHKSHAEVRSADAPERRPVETPIPLPTTSKSEAHKNHEEPASKPKSSKKRKREQSDEGSSKPALDEAEAPNAGHVSKTKKKHGESRHESDSRTTEGKKDKKKKHTTHQASRSPSPPPRKKTKRVQHDGETAPLASGAPHSSHKSHEHADKEKEKKGKGAKAPTASEVSEPGPSKSVASNGDTAREVSEDEWPTHTEGHAPTPRSSKKKQKKDRRKSKLPEPLETQPAQPSKAMDVDSGSEKPGAEPEAKSEKHSKKARRRSIAAREALATLPFAGAQDSPAKPVPGHHESKSATSLPPPPPKRKRSPSPPSEEESRPTDVTKLSLASSTSVFSLPTLTRFANDSLVLPEPPEGMSSKARRRWRKKMRKSMQQLPNEARPDIGAEIDNSTPQKASAGPEAAKSDDEIDAQKPDRKKAKVNDQSDERATDDDAASKVHDILERRPGSLSKPAALPRPVLKRLQVTATGSFAQDEPVSSIPSPKRSGSAHEQRQYSTFEEATVSESIPQDPQAPATEGFAHDEPLEQVSSPERHGSVHESPAPPAASESPLKSDVQGWDTLPAQYLSDSEPEAQDASDVEPDMPIEPAQSIQPEQTGDEDADTDSSKDPESETESESDSGFEAEGIFKPIPRPPHFPKTPSQILTPSQCTLDPPASLQAKPLWTLTQLKASTPTLANSRPAVPLKPKTPPKANVKNVDILGIEHGTDESDESSESSSSSSSDDDDGDRKKTARTNTTNSASLSFPSSRLGKSLAEPKTPLPGKTAPEVRRPSPKTSTANMEKPLADTLDSDAGSGDSDESASASSDDGNDNYQEAAPLNINQMTPPQAQSSRTTKTNSPEMPPSKQDDSRVDDTGMPQQSDDEASSEHESDGEKHGMWTSINQEPESRPVQSPQQTKLKSAQSPPPALRSPKLIRTAQLPQPVESNQENAHTEQGSDQAESVGKGDVHAEINGANDTAAEPQPVDGQAGEPEQEHSISPKSSETGDPTPFESAPQTPVYRPSSSPRQEQLNSPASHTSRSPSANDIINGIALSGSKKGSSVEQDVPHEREQSPVDLEAHKFRVNQAATTDRGLEAETMSDTHGESLKPLEKSNHNHGMSTNYDEPDSPPVYSTKQRPTSTDQSHSSPSAAAIENDELNMGQDVSAVELEDVSILAVPPPPEIQGAVISNSSSRSLHRQAGQFCEADQANSPGESQGVANSPRVLYNRSGQPRARERSAPAESELPVSSKSAPQPLRNRTGQFCRKDGSTKQESNRKPRTKESRRKSNQFVLRELGIDIQTYRADDSEDQNEGSQMITRGSQRSPAEESRESPSSTRRRRLRSTPRVSYQDGYDSSESVTKTTARRLSFSSRKTKSHTRRTSSHQISRPAKSPSPRSDDDLPSKAETPSKMRSTFVGVFIPVSHPDKSAASPNFRDGKSAELQDEDMVASTADADQANDDDSTRELEILSSPSAGAQDDDSAADYKGADEEEALQRYDTADSEQDHGKDDESVPSGYQSSDRPVFTVSYPVLSSPQAAAADDSTLEHVEEVDGAEFDVTREESPVPEIRDSGADEKAQSPEPPSEAEVENQGRDQDERREHGHENDQDESREGSDEDQVLEAASRGSDYSFDDDPNGFINEDGTVSGQATPRRHTGLHSNHFSPPKASRPPAGAPRLPFPSTETDTYGLIQEQLTDKPLFMLIANMLLNRTNGKQAIPKFWELVEKYPTVDDLVAADLVELTEMIRPLGLQSRRALSIITLARLWLTNPPVKGRRYRKMNYPSKGAHLDIRPGEILSDEDPRVAAFEVCHLTNVGDYALDSWRIFCRDQLRGCASGFNGEDAEPGFEPEWKRVRASDKELQGFLRWMWIREGWIYDPVTGEKRRASEDEEEAAKIATLRWNQEKGEAYIIGDDAPDGGEGEGSKDCAGDTVPASGSNSSPSSHVPSPADDPSSQLEREQRNRAAQSQLAQAQLLREEQQQRLTMSQPRPSTAAYAERTPKPKGPSGTLSTAPATLPTRLRRTTTTATTSTSSSPVSAYRSKPTPLDLFSDDNDDSVSNFGLRRLFRTPRRRRGSSAKWAVAGVVDETPPGSPRLERQQQNGVDNKTTHDGNEEQDMDDFSIFGDDHDHDQDHDHKDKDHANGNSNGINGHREVGHDHWDKDDDDDEKTRLAFTSLREGKGDAGHVKVEEEGRRSPSGGVNEPAAGDGSQESNKSCRVM